MQIWRTNPHLQTAASLLESTDAVAQAFAMSLPPQALVIDLRHPQFGQGFSWGRFGPKTRIRRAGEDRIWAIIPPERKPGFLTQDHWLLMRGLPNKTQTDERRGRVGAFLQLRLAAER